MKKHKVLDKAILQKYYFQKRQANLSIILALKYLEERDLEISGYFFKLLFNGFFNVSKMTFNVNIHKLYNRNVIDAQNYV